MKRIITLLVVSMISTCGGVAHACDKENLGYDVNLHTYNTYIDFTKLDTDYIDMPITLDIPKPGNNSCIGMWIGSNNWDWSNMTSCPKLKYK